MDVDQDHQGQCIQIRNTGNVWGSNCGSWTNMAICEGFTVNKFLSTIKQNRTHSLQRLAAIYQVQIIYPTVYLDLKVSQQEMLGRCLSDQPLGEILLALLSILSLNMLS